MIENILKETYVTPMVELTQNEYNRLVQMANNEYPRKLTFKAPDSDRLTEDAKEHIRKVTEGTTITMLAENIIKIEYPAELIDHIKTVRVDYINYRLDFIDHGNVYWMCNCYFPQGTGWGREFFKNRWDKGKRLEAPGCLIIEYPSCIRSDSIRP